MSELERTAGLVKAECHGAPVSHRARPTRQRREVDERRGGVIELGDHHGPLESEPAREASGDEDQDGERLVEGKATGEPARRQANCGEQWRGEGGPGDVSSWS